MIVDAEPQVAAELDVQLLQLEQADLPTLRSQWLALFGNPAPRRIHHKMLLKAVAWKLQVNALGDVSPGTLRRMRTVAAELTARRLKARAEGKSDVQLRLAPGPRTGTRLIRVWHGDTHVVEVTASGYEYQSKVYRSLSTIAQRITGTKWNGPLFFGLRENRIQPVPRPAQQAPSPALPSTKVSVGA
jgi:hypothetical protein